MSKSRERKEAEARDQQAKEERRQAELQRQAAQEAEARITKAGETARQQMMEAAQPRQEETARLERYRGKATTPGETLMTQTGPISQAVARRIQERVEAPGMDFDVAAPAYAEQIGAPLWRGLKSRGIAPRPGAEGGLGVSQYMQSAAPAMAILRQQQIGQDIGRGQEYGQEARRETGFYEELERSLGDLIADRLFRAGVEGAGAQQLGVREGAPYGPRGAEAYAGGYTRAAGIEAEYAAERAQRQKEKRAKEGEMVRQLAELAIILGTGGTAAPAVAAGRTVAPGGRTFQPARETGGYFKAPSLKLMEEQTPYSRALATRAGRY